MRVVSIEVGDITKFKGDAIVNAANRSLCGGGGVDGAIHRAAGPGLLEECKRLGGCDVGDAKATGGYDLFAKHVIHTVGPVWDGGGKGERALLEACYKNSMRVADSLGVKSIAFPAISCGAYRFPISLAAEISVRTIESEIGKTNIESATIILFDEKTRSEFQRSIKGIE